MLLILLSFSQSLLLWARGLRALLVTVGSQLSASQLSFLTFGLARSIWLAARWHTG